MRLVGYLLYLSLLLLVGCVSQYEGGFYFLPHPGIASVPATQPWQSPPVVAQAMVIGIRNPDSQLHIPLSVEIRLRLENNGSDYVTFDPRTMELTSADLMRFPPPLVNTASPSPLAIAPGQSAAITADFPLGEDKSEPFDISSLHLRWTVQIASRAVQQNIDFRGEDPYPRYYYGPYWDGYPYAYSYPIVGGVWIVHRR